MNNLVPCARPLPCSAVSLFRLRRSGNTLRSWDLEGRADNEGGVEEEWVLLRRHHNCSELQTQAGATASWDLPGVASHFRWVWGALGVGGGSWLNVVLI